MRHPTFGWGNCICPGFCRRMAYSASPEWWQCFCRRKEYPRTMQHSVARAGNLLRERSDMWQRLSFTTRVSGRGWYYHLGMLDFGGGRTLSFECTGGWFGLGDTQKDCPWIEDKPPKSPAHFARWTVVGHDLPCKSRGLSCRGNSKYTAPATLT